MTKTLSYKITLILFLVALFICTCAAHGRYFDQKKLEQVKIGVHNKEDIRELFGNPYMTSVDSNGNEMWSYDYIFAMPFGVVENKHLYIFFNKGIVSSYKTLGEGFENINFPQHKVKLGVLMNDAYKGVEIVKVFKNSPAEKAGLKRGDIILKIDTEKTEFKERVIGILSNKNENDKMIFFIIRDDKMIKIPVKL